MRIAYTTIFDANDVHNWSGTPYYMSRAFNSDDTQVEYIGNLERKLPPFFKLKQAYKKFICGQRESPRFNIVAAKHYSEQTAKKLEAMSVDAIVSPLINPIAYLDTKKPVVLWTDALYASLLGFYSPFSAHSASTIAEGNQVTNACLSRCDLAIFSSEWAANSARELYGVSREKVKVVPFGANIETWPTPSEIETIIARRAKDKIKLLFLAKSWERKGGDVVLEVARTLHEAGYPVELTVVGYQPPGITTPPPYLRCLGYISKHTPEGSARIRELLAETHFLFVPSRAEAYGIVFCEANAFAVPCLTTYVGGIGTIVKDNINGMTFGLDASIQSYCEYITNLMHERARYDEMAKASYHEFITRLNWPAVTNQVKQLIAEIK